MNTDGSKYVSRAGEKLAAALVAFKIDVSGLVCTDFGSHTGGFVDCLLQQGAGRVHAVDPGYGIFDFKLRRDPRVVLHERTNALRYLPTEASELVTLDVGWTPQRLILPAVLRALTGAGRVANPGGRAVSLIKPHYEAPREWLEGGVLPVDRLAGVLADVRRDAVELGWRIEAEMESPIQGHAGNTEFLWLLTRAAT